MLRTSTRLAVLLLTLIAAGRSDAQTDAGSGGVNADRHADAPYVVLVSIDGFRHDYQKRFDTPALDRIAASGLRADALLPVYPTLTFPNHYSIATGLYPANHGIVDNTFYDEQRRRRYSLSDRSAVQDGSWYHGNPLWVVAEQSGMVTAAYFFVGTEADIQGIRPTYWKRFNASIPGGERVRQVLEWLSLPDERRPHLVTLYFEDVDVVTHRDGVNAATLPAAVALVDGFIGALLDGIEALPIAGRTYVLLVSDHGQANYRRAAPFVLGDLIDLTGVRTVEHGSSVSLYFETPDRQRARAIADKVNDNWRRGQAIVPGEAPDAWQVNAGSRFADVIVQADSGAAVVVSPGQGRSGGDHGWPPGDRNMHGFFLAAGPRLPAGRRIAAFESIDIYPLIMNILGLPIPAPIDGNPATLVPLLDAE